MIYELNPILMGWVNYLKGLSYRLKDKKRFQVKLAENQQEEKEDIEKTDKTAI